jgi:hypothetical protein
VPWFKVDDSFHSHPKILACSPAALGLWVVAGSWAAANPSDGFIPAHVLPRLMPNCDALIEELIERRLWMRAKGGYRVRNWTEYQPSREEIETARRHAAERQRKRRQRLNGQVTPPDVTPVSQRDSHSDNSVSHSTPTRPDPTRPLVVSSEVEVPVSNASENGNVYDFTEEPRSRSYTSPVWKLAKLYASKVNPSNPANVAAHITNATQTWDMDLITKAVEKMAKEARSLSADSLRIELNQLGCDKSGMQRLIDGSTVDWNTGIRRSKNGIPLSGGGYRSGKASWSDG